MRNLILTSLGPASIAAANLLLSISIFIKYDAKYFGLFAFMQVLVGFAYGIINSVIGNPLSLQLNKDGLTSTKLGFYVQTIVSLSSLMSLFAAILFALSFLNIQSAVAIGLYFLFSTFRWAGRHFNLAHGNLLLCLYSDIIFAFGSMVAFVCIIFRFEFTYENALWVIALISMFSCAVLGRQFITWIKVHIRLVNFPSMTESFRKYGKWALVGVVATEATANSQAYIVSGLMGAESFAIIGATVLVFRPTLVILNAWTQVAKRRLSRLAKDENTPEMFSFIKQFRFKLLVFFALNCGLALLVAYLIPRELLEDRYDLHTFFILGGIWAIVIFLRCLRASYSLFMQSLGEFRALSGIFIKTGILTMVTCTATTLLFGVVGSMFGLILGESVAVLMIHFETNKQMKKGKQ